MALDLVNNLLFKTSIKPQALTATADGTGVDRAGYASVMFCIAAGTQAGTSNTFKVQDSDDNSTFADIDDALLSGGTNGIAITTSNDVKNHTLGYLGIKRYVRVICSAVSSGNLPSAGIVIMGNYRNAPITEESAG